MSEEKDFFEKETYFDDAQAHEDGARETFLDKLVANSRIIIVGIGATLSILIGTAMYTSAQEAESSQYGYSDSSTYGYQYTGQSGGQYNASSGGYSAQYAVQTNNADSGAAAASGGGCGGGGASASGGGSGCGGGAASGGGSGCGGGGSASGTSVAPAELEKQALEKYKAENGNTDVTVKVEDRGCHTQIDVYDKTGKIVRSYGFQGGPLYVIS